MKEKRDRNQVAVDKTKTTAHEIEEDTKEEFLKVKGMPDVNLITPMDSPLVWHQHSLVCRLTP